MVPPGNSAATQYTETFPTSGGEAQVNGGINGSDMATPQKVLGKESTRSLESQGADGKATAEVAAATSSPPVTTTTDAGKGGNGGSSQSGKGKEGAAVGKSESRGSGGVAKVEEVAQLRPSGSSGLSEVLGQATGSSSSGQLGIFLPLLLLATVAGSIAYLYRQRHAA